ncbi:hypothetical protein [Solidesulfovibrio magneticus]|jgi:hypothetical protein|uniref:Hypothetical membrane protein n=1 Tax=Solidesulfovibrio magneticus (strain ATCC 700980 / DSM 13731 / RS-1) TaxID=573370 RepID=C4XJJ8_SOLM1|nr:hypothetical protein [Solidesulfovibrio magneticus]BAH76745.1 hypothetical membrane protein [Solidesulfovibrio magneticus RS-1]
MKASTLANAFIGFLNLNAFLFQVAVISIIVLFKTGSFIAAILVFVTMLIVLSFKKFAWIVVGGLSASYCYIGWLFFGFYGLLILGLVGFGLNWSVSQLLQLASGDNDE